MTFVKCLWNIDKLVTCLLTRQQSVFFIDSSKWTCTSFESIMCRGWGHIFLVSHPNAAILMAAGATRDGPQLLFRHHVQKDHDQHTTPFRVLHYSMTSLSTLGRHCCVDCDCKFSNIEVANQVCQNRSTTQSKLRAAQVLCKLVFQTP